MLYDSTSRCAIWKEALRIYKMNIVISPRWCAAPRSPWVGNTARAIRYRLRYRASSGVNEAAVNSRIWPSGTSLYVRAK